MKQFFGYLQRNCISIDGCPYFPLFFLTVSCFFVILMAMNNKHFYDYFKLILLISYFLITLWYLTRFQWRFIPEKSGYDLLLGLVYLWILMIFSISMIYEDRVGPPEQMDDVANMIARYFLPILLIVPGLFSKEKMKYTVWFSLITFPLCAGIIGNFDLMGSLVDHRRDVPLLSSIGFSLFYWGVFICIVSDSSLCRPGLQFWL